MSAGEQFLLAATGHFHVRQWAVFHVRRQSGVGATHTTELLAAFDVYRTHLGRLLSAGADRRSAMRVSDDIQKRWVAFAHKGVPGDGCTRYTRDARAVLVFDQTSRVENDPDAARLQAWEGFNVLTR